MDDEMRVPEEEPSDWHAYTSRQAFYDSLAFGDVLLFEGYNDAGAYDIFMERRPVYHSAMWIGMKKGKPLAMHNVSNVWWIDQVAAASKSQRDVLKLGYVFGDPLAKSAAEDALVELMRKRHHHAEAGELTDAQRRAMRRLLKVGGVGYFNIDAYLDDSRFVEHGRVLRHLRSITALRHEIFGEKVVKSPTATDLGHQKRIRAAIHSRSGIVNSVGFPAADLVAALPNLLKRADYSLFGTGPEGDEVNRQLGELLGGPSTSRLQVKGYHAPVGAPRWICAMWVRAVLEAAGLQLTVVADGKLTHDFGAEFITPRDLWDCAELQPRGVFVRAPERASDPFPFTDADLQSDPK